MTEVNMEQILAERRERDIERMQGRLKRWQLSSTRKNAERHLDAIYADEIKHRRWNWEGMPENTPAQRVYKGLSALQLAFQENDDEASHDLLCDDVLDTFHKRHRSELS